MSSPSAFCGEHSTTAGYSTPILLGGVHPSGLVESKFVGACIWDEFLDDCCCARTLDPCVSSFVIIPRFFFRVAPFAVDQKADISHVSVVANIPIFNTAKIITIPEHII